jgi:hypothetical protein
LQKALAFVGKQSIGVVAAGSPLARLDLCPADPIDPGLASVRGRIG